MMTKNIPVQIASNYIQDNVNMYAGYNSTRTPKFSSTASGWPHVQGYRDTFGVDPYAGFAATPVGFGTMSYGSNAFAANSAFGGIGTGRAYSQASTQVFTPATDILENDNELVILADLPGVDPSCVNIHLTNNQLIIQALRTDRIIGKQDSIYEFYRAFELSPNISLKAITADFQAGVLRICLPKVDVFQNTGVKVRPVVG